MPNVTDEPTELPPDDGALTDGDDDDAASAPLEQPDGYDGAALGEPEQSAEGGFQSEIDDAIDAEVDHHLEPVAASTVDGAEAAFDDDASAVESDAELEVDHAAAATTDEVAAVADESAERADDPVAAAPQLEEEREWPPEPRPARSGLAWLPWLLTALAVLAVLLLALWGCSALTTDDDEDEPGTASSIEGEETPGPTTVEEAESPSEVIVIARPSWESGWFQAEINAHLIRELGYTVNDPSTLQGDPFTIYPSMERGEIDLWAHAWIPGHNPFINADAISLVGPQVFDGGPTGLLVPSAWASENGIRTMDDIISNPDRLSEVDLDGDGIIDILGCEPEWDCWAHIENLVAANNWPALQQSNPHEFHIEAMEQRLDIGLPTIIFAWGPDPMLHRLQLGDQTQWLAINSDIPDAGLVSGPVTATVPDGHCTADPCVSPFGHDEIYAAANTAFLAAHPDIEALLEQIDIPAQDIWAQNDQMDNGEASNADVQRHATEWIAANRDLVDSWLNN